MTGALVVARRELTGLFMAPFTWIVLLVVLLLNGLLFNSYLVRSGGNITATLNASMSEGSFWVWMVFLPALLSMRLIAEESRNGTLEYLLTAPVGDLAVVVGKFLAATLFLGLVWTSALVYAGALDYVGGSPDWPAIIGTWVGTLLVSGLFVSIGMLASTFTATPLLAAFLSMVACVLWLTLPWLALLALSNVLPYFAETGAELKALSERAETVVGSMDAIGHFQRSFQVGVIDSAEVIFFFAWTGLFLFLTARSLEARRWRG
ncbi:ABC-2 family transporter protein [Planctomycetes bacterium Poly30]|uniref:ABC-2 family transporter protein n=1 Tax=Saltatorellus ferox TaxID=2528018 RepID=A0A518ETR8_9BACT|nr:ABC-2 family transporter protein [Planctomycetes bacterium Poly30]